MRSQGRRQEAGDRAVKEAADVLRETFRSEDIMARIGGDEFVVLVTDSSMVPAAGSLLPRRPAHVQGQTEVLSREP